jgi:hypothetical protein
MVWLLITEGALCSRPAMLLSGTVQTKQNDCWLMVSASDGPASGTRLHRKAPNRRHDHDESIHPVPWLRISITAA